MTQQLMSARVWIEQSRGRLVIGLVLLVGLYFVVAFGEQAWKARQLQGEVAERQAVIAEMEARRAELQQQLVEYNSDDYLSYVERSARRDLNLSHPGETVLLVRWLDPPPPTPATDATATPPAQQKPNWERWLELFHVR